MSPRRHWLRRLLSRGGDEDLPAPDCLLNTEAWRMATEALSKDTGEVFASTAHWQDAVFQISLGLTGAGGEAVLEPDPGKKGGVHIKKYRSLPIILEEKARALIMEQVEVPRSPSSNPVIKVSARICLRKRRILDRSIPLLKFRTVYFLKIRELYQVASHFQSESFPQTLPTDEPDPEGGTNA